MYYALAIGVGTEQRICLNHFGQGFPRLVNLAESFLSVVAKRDVKEIASVKAAFRCTGFCHCGGECDS